MELSQAIQWAAMALGIVAAIMVAAKINAKITGWGFVIFAVSSVGWVAFGAMEGEAPLTIQNAVLLLINGVGVWRYLIAKEKDVGVPSSCAQ